MFLISSGSQTVDSISGFGLVYRHISDNRAYPTAGFSDLLRYFCFLQWAVISGIFRIWQSGGMVSVQSASLQWVSGGGALSRVQG